MTDPRPPTVLNVLLPREQDGQPRSFRLPAAAAATRMQQSRDAPDNAAVSSLAPAARELDQLSAQLRDKTKDLLAANLSQTKLFFRQGWKKTLVFFKNPAQWVFLFFFGFFGFFGFFCPEERVLGFFPVSRIVYDLFVHKKSV